jgi:hypothetical protein
MSIGKRSYFRRYWIGEALSTLGTRTGNIAYPLLALELTGSPARAGLLAFGRSAAWFVLQRVHVPAAPPRLDGTGNLRRVLPRRRGGRRAPPRRGRGSPDGDRAEHCARLGRVARRAAGRWLLYAVRRSLPFVVDLVSFLVSAAMLASIRKPFHEEREHEPWSVRTHLGEIRDGVSWLWSQPFLRTATLLVGGANFVSNAISLLLVVVVRERGGSAPEIGLMLSFAAAGSLLGAVAATRLHRIVAPRLIVVGYPWFGTLAALVIAFPLPPRALGAVFGAWVFFGPTWDAVVGGRRIRIVPDAMQGRVESVTGLVAIGSAAVGPLVGGLLASSLSGSASFLVVAAIGTVVALGGVAAWSRGLRAVAAEAPA